MDIRSLQRPLKDAYRQAPASSRITLVAHGRQDRCTDILLRRPRASDL